MGYPDPSPFRSTSDSHDREEHHAPIRPQQHPVGTIGSPRTRTSSHDPGITDHATQAANTPNPTRSAGKYSGAGATLQGLIAATTKKGNGLVQPLADAINYLIQNGQYAKWLAA
jgi:hypothetical protein